MTTPKNNRSNTYSPEFRFYNLAIYFIFLSLFAVNFNGSHNGQHPAPGVTAELLFNEGTGTTTADGSGNGHNGTLVNNPVWGPGKYGQGLTFNGTSSYVNIPDHTDFTLDPAQSYSWSAWIKNNDFHEWAPVWSQTLNSANFFYFYAHTSSDPDGGPVTNGISVYWWVNNGASKLGAHSNNNVLTVGTWSYVTVTYDASQPQNNRFSIYVNGTDVTNRTDVASVGTLTAIDPTNIRIGSDQPFPEYYNGSIDEVRYYRRLLSLAEIQSDMNIGNTPDTQAPTVSITAPPAGNVSGTVNVTANAADNVGVAGVQFLLDGVNLGAEDIASPYSVSWNTVTATNGNHNLTARARDAAGNTTTSSVVTVNVNNVADTVAPTVSITSPTGGTVTGTINVNANAADNIGVVGVQFLLNGANLGSEDVASPYSVSWNTVSLANGNYTLTARARDAAGNTTTSLPISVTVSNVNLVAAYSFNENSGTIANDNSGNGNTGTLTNSPTWSATGKYGGAILFNGTNSFVNINDANSLDLTTGMTIEAWVNPSNVTGYKTVICKENGTNNLAYTLAANNNTSGSANQRPNARIRSGSATTTITGTTKLVLNTWAHLACTYDGTNLRYYQNGALVSTVAVTASIAVTANPLRIGGSTALGNQYFAGLIDEVRIYNRALSQSEIQTDMITPIAPDVTPPTVTITTPPVGGNVVGTVSVMANASDNIGVAGVQFKLNGVNLGAEVLTAPYSISWNTTTSTNGPDTLTAVARDGAGNVATSSQVIVNVNNPVDTQGPTVNITAPAAGNVSGTLNVTANASDNVGVVGVQFKLNNVNLGSEDMVAPYSVPWNTLTSQNGPYTLTAVARDAAGNTTTSSGVVVTVNNDTQAPTVNITAPVAGTNVSGTVNVTANASDNVGVVGVQFKLNGVNLGTEDLSSPYSVSWNTLTSTNGPDTLTAVARDSSGNTTTSTAVIVNVNNAPDTQGPTVSITAPATGNVSGTVNVTANASDNVGVVGVQFKLNGTNLGSEDLSSPYSYSWNTATSPNGNYTLTAVARDAAGNTTTSAGVAVTISNASNLVAALAFNEGSGTTTADASGNSHPGTLVNSPVWGVGKYGQGLTFNGTSNYVNIADHNDFTLDPAQSYTWSAWIKNTDFHEWSPVFSQTIDGNNFVYFYAHTTNDPDGGPVTSGISVYWWANGGTNKLGVHSNNNVLTLNQWSHVAVTYDGTQAQNNRFSIFVNGVDVTNRTDVASVGTLPIINPTNIRIGSDQPFPEYFNGSIDEVRFYKRLLTAAEITSDMNTPINGAPDTTAPSVSMTGPPAGNVSGTVNVTANASDNIGVIGVQFFLDGMALGAEVVAAPYSISWNTGTTPNGSHNLTARARDAAGNTATTSILTVNVNNLPDFTFTVLNSTRNVDPSGSTNYGVDVGFINGFNSNVTLAVSGLPAGVTGSYVTNPMTAQGSNQLLITSANAAPGTYTITLTATGQSIVHSQTAILIVNGGDDFGVTANTSIQSVAAGGGTSYFVNVTASGNFTGNVNLSITGLPANMTAVFSPTAGAAPYTSVLTITTLTSTPVGNYNFNVTGTSGAVTHTLPITLTVVATPPATWPVTNLGSGWNMPVGVAFSKDGQKMFVWEKGGVLWVCNRNSSSGLYDKQATPVLDINEEVGNWNDMGMLGFALDPNFDVNGLIYLSYIVDRNYLLNFGTPGYTPLGDNASAQQATIGRITRYQTVNSGGVITANLASRTILLGETKSTGIPILYDSHGVGTLLFAADGTLIASCGDAASYADYDQGSIATTYYAQAIADGILRPNENVGSFRSQMITCLNGKLLRLNPANGDGMPSNPFYDPSQPRAPRSRVYALGLRNPFRVSIRPGTGSTNPDAGDIGEIYVADVGMGTWEELNVIKEPGTNCGWPFYEGLQLMPQFQNPVPNKDEPNPLFGTGGCTQQYFNFQDLFKQATADNARTVYNPCNPSQPIGTGARFVHRRPLLDYKHDADTTRVGIFNGNTASVAQIGTAASGVSGTPFRGNAITGGCWYTGTLFPSNFRNTFMFGDYGRSFIKSLTVNYTDVLQQVQHFADVATPVCLTQNPLDGTLVYANVETNTITRISYGGNQFPVVKMTSNVIYGPSPLNVTFTGSNSYDPEGGRLTYSWNFGDGSALSTAANPPVHSFTAPAGVPTKFVVKLTVKDSVNATATDSIIISVNNTPPVVHITSPINNSTYEIGLDTIYNFTANVTDAEQGPSQLKYEWQQILRHNQHEHPGPIDTVRNTFGSVARIGCNGDTYYWLFRLKVTDAAGLSTMDSSKIFPNCPTARTALALRKFSVTPESREKNVVKWMTDMAPQIKSFEVERGPDGVNFYTITSQDAMNTTGTKDYSFDDVHFAPGLNYYRLKMLEVGDVERYSVIVKAISPPLDNGIPLTLNDGLSIIPNPATSNFSVLFDAKEAGQVTIRIADINGRVITTIRESVNQGQNIIYIQSQPSWTPGVYLLTAQQGNNIQNGKLMKAK